MIDLRDIFSRDFRSKLMYALSFLPDKMYLQLFYFATTRKFIDFKNPKGFNEKLQFQQEKNQAVLKNFFL